MSSPTRNKKGGHFRLNVVDLMDPRTGEFLLSRPRVVVRSRENLSGCDGCNN
jgi:hypothetical protein